MSHPDYKNIGPPSIRLIEECGELIKAVCKAERFGWENWHPDIPERTNFDDVLKEYSDVKEAMESLLSTLGPLNESKPVCGTCGGKDSGFSPYPCPTCGGKR